MLEHKIFSNTDKLDKLILANAFNHEILDVFRSLNYVRNDEGKISASLTLNFMKSVKGANKVYSRDEASNIIKNFYVLNRSKFIMGAMTSNPFWGNLTPVGLYCCKEASSVPYEHWDKSDPLIKVFLGKPLEFLIKLNDEESTERKVLDSLENRTKELGFNRCRNMTLTRKTDGTIEKVTSNRMNLVYTASIKHLGHMFFQTWLAHASLREPGVMILDWNNWDNVPESVDEVTINPVKIKPIEDLKW